MSGDRHDKTAYLNATPMQREAVRRHLCDVLACLRAQSLSYQTSHWQVVGQSFYGNHLLFQRLYKSVLEQVDQLAEKVVGYLGSEVVGLESQMKHIYQYTASWSQIGCNHKRGLQSEADLQMALKHAYEGIKNVNAMTLGLDDWIMATANAHEENEYLLQQALAPIPGQKQAAFSTALKSRKREDLIGYFYALHDQLEREFNHSAEQIQGMSNAVLRRRTMQLAEQLADTDVGGMTGEEAVKAAQKAAPAAYRHMARMMGGEKLASGAPTAEGDFYKAPDQRAVLDFADSNAISNIVEVAEKASEEDHLDIPESEAVAQAEEAPPTPTEIVEEPGGAAVSTLNQYVIESNDPVAEEAVAMNKARMAAWLRELV